MLVHTPQRWFLDGGMNCEWVSESYLARWWWDCEWVKATQQLLSSIQSHVVLKGNSMWHSLSLPLSNRFSHLHMHGILNVSHQDQFFFLVANFVKESQIFHFMMLLYYFSYIFSGILLYKTLFRQPPTLLTSHWSVNFHITVLVLIDSTWVYKWFVMWFLPNQKICKSM